MASTGWTVPRTVTRRPMRMRPADIAIATLGRTLTRVEADSSRGRPEPPPYTARTRPLCGSATWPVQRPSAPQVAVPICCHAAPPAWNSMASAAPLGEDPSPKRTSPESVTGRSARTRRVLGLAVTRETGEALPAARSRSAGSCA